MMNSRHLVDAIKEALGIEDDGRTGCGIIVLLVLGFIILLLIMVGKSLIHLISSTKEKILLSILISLVLSVLISRIIAYNTNRCNKLSMGLSCIISGVIICQPQISYLKSNPDLPNIYLNSNTFFSYETIMTMMYILAVIISIVISLVVVAIANCVVNLWLYKPNAYSQKTKSWQCNHCGTYNSIRVEKCELCGRNKDQ